MRSSYVVAAALAAGALLGWSASGQAQESKPAFLGSISARTYVHSYKMPFDVGVDRDWKPPERIDEERQLVLIPDIYGELIHVTEHGDDVVMWFRDAEGIVRNSVIQGVSTRLINLQRAPARHIGYSYR